MSLSRNIPLSKRVDSPPSEFISKQIPPPIPTQLPPSLLESITDLKSVSPNASPPSPTPTPPSPPPHRVSTSEYPISSDTFLTKERNRTSYPVQDNILGAAVPLRNKLISNQSLIADPRMKFQMVIFDQQTTQKLECTINQII